VFFVGKKPPSFGGGGGEISIGRAAAWRLAPTDVFCRYQWRLGDGCRTRDAIENDFAAGTTTASRGIGSTSSWQ